MIEFLETPYHLQLVIVTAVYITVMLHHLAPMAYSKYRAEHLLLVGTVITMLIYSWVDIYNVSADPTPPPHNGLMLRISYTVSYLASILWMTLLNQLLRLRQTWLMRLIWGSGIIAVILAFFPILIGSENNSFFNEYSHCWYHGKELGPAAAVISAFGFSSMLYLSFRGCMLWRQNGIADMLFALISLGVTIMTGLDMLVFNELINFMFTWPLACALFALACSLRLGVKAMETAYELEKAHAELQAFNAQSLKMQRLSTMGMIVRGVIHDLKNFFLVANQMSTIGRDLISNKQYKRASQCFDSILDNSTDAEAYLRSMLEMADGAQGANCERIELQKLVYLVIKVCELQFQTPAIDVKFMVPRDVEVETDPRILQQILLNLSFNATKVLREKTSGERLITYSCHSTTKEVVLSLEDTGPGLPPEAIEVLESNIDALNLTAKGVGLRLIRQGCDKLGIMLEYKPAKEGHGTRFELHFPKVSSA